MRNHRAGHVEVRSYNVQSSQVFATIAVYTLTPHVDTIIAALRQEHGVASWCCTDPAFASVVITTAGHICRSVPAYSARYRSDSQIQK